MIVSAVRRACRPVASRTDFLVHSAVFLIACCLAAPAAAEVGATVSVFSDARFRGYSLSQGRPVAVLDLAYDDGSGFYLDASGTGVFRRDGHAAPLGLQLNAGYAKRLRSGTILDFGITNSTYSHYSLGEAARSYTEVYAGISSGGLSSRIFLSPHYSETGLWTAYGEVNGTISPARKWSIDGHVGMLVPIRTPSGGERYRSAFDWRLGVTRELGPVSLHASWNEGARGRTYYGDHALSGRSLVIGASWIL